MNTIRDRSSMSRKSPNDPRTHFASVTERVVTVLHELGVCFDEEGRPHLSKTNERITMENLQLDPVVLITAITRYVGFDCVDER